MNVAICSPPEIEERIDEDDTAVVVDALRASATATTLLNCGAETVDPVADADDADTDGALVAGEHHGERIEGFDLGNSPLEIQDRAELVKGRDVVLRTTNGTRCVERVDHAANVLMGSPINEASLVETCIEGLPDEGDVYLVPARRRGEYASEDAYAATRIERRFEEELGRESTDPDEEFEGSPEEVFRRSDTGQFLIGKGNGDDVQFCAQADVCEAVPVLEDGRFVDGGPTSDDEPLTDHEATGARNHVADVQEGAGCTEIWEHLSERRADSD